MSPARERGTPQLRTALTRPHQFLALAGGIGVIPVWPGTFGSLAGFGLYAAMQPLPLEWRAMVYVALLAVGSWAIARTGDDLGAPDHNAIVLDEMVAMSLVVEFIAPGAVNFTAGFLLFRFFDVVKPWPASLVHRSGGGGFMVILDDLVAAIYAALAVRLVVAPLWGYLP